MPTTDDKTVDLSKLRAFADNKNNRDSLTEICCRKGRKLCGKRKKNAVNKHFLLFPSCFQIFFVRVVKNPDRVVKGLNHKSGKYPESI